MGINRKKGAESKEILLIDENFLFFFFFLFPTPLLPQPCSRRMAWLHYAMLEFLKYREIARDDDVIILSTGDDHHPGREIGRLPFNIVDTIVFIKLLYLCYLVYK